MAPATKRNQAPKRPPREYLVVVVPPERPDPSAAQAVLTWLTERGKR